MSDAPKSGKRVDTSSGNHSAKKSRTWIKVVGIFLGLLIVGLISFGWFFNRYVIGGVIEAVVLGAFEEARKGE